mmetsp:Transcript_6682/g.10217  ORF Transcript_6682/g.10217 Transcript_6682/m.10217 type:complete len:775 (-) Transcript_6682:201-2525(-)
MGKEMVEKGIILKKGTEPRWKILQKIGFGTFSEIFSAKDLKKKNVRVAVKVATKKRGAVSSLEHESKVLQSLQGCPFVCKYYYFGKDEKESITFLVMELLKKGSLSKVRKEGRSALMAGQVGMEMLQCIESIHKLGYIHRDIKPSNFGFPYKRKRKYECRILDFGISRRHLDDKGKPRQSRGKTAFRGCVLYASPAAHNCLDLGRRDDIWSLFNVVIDLSFSAGVPWNTPKALKDRDHALQLKKDFYAGNGLGGDYFRSFPSMLRFKNHLDSLKYEEEPDYLKLQMLLRQLISPKPTIIDITDDGPLNGENESKPKPSGELRHINETKLQSPIKTVKPEVPEIDSVAFCDQPITAKPSLIPATSKSVSKICLIDPSSTPKSVEETLGETQAVLSVSPDEAQDALSVSHESLSFDDENFVPPLPSGPPPIKPPLPRGPHPSTLQPPQLLANQGGIILGSGKQLPHGFGIQQQNTNPIIALIRQQQIPAKNQNMNLCNIQRNLQGGQAMRQMITLSQVRNAVSGAMLQAKTQQGMAMFPNGNLPQMKSANSMNQQRIQLQVRNAASLQGQKRINNANFSFASSTLLPQTAIHGIQARGVPVQKRSIHQVFMPTTSSIRSPSIPQPPSKRPLHESSPTIAPQPPVRPPNSPAPVPPPPPLPQVTPRNDRKSKKIRKVSDHVSLLSFPSPLGKLFHEEARQFQKRFGKSFKITKKKENKERTKVNFLEDVVGSQNNENSRVVNGQDSYSRNRTGIQLEHGNGNFQMISGTNSQVIDLT